MGMFGALVGPGNPGTASFFLPDSQKHQGDKLCPHILTHDFCWDQWKVAVLLWKQNFAWKTESSRDYTTLFTARNLVALLSLPASPPNSNRKSWPCVFERLSYYECAKLYFFNAAGFQKVWWRVRYWASKYIQEGKYQTVKINLDTIIKISSIVDIVGGVALHLSPLTNSLLYVNMAESSALHDSPPETLRCMQVFMSCVQDPSHGGVL